ncbi:NAD(P)H-dependent oxidoreductase [Streptomyces caniscabiei]|uniref:NADPH-dependent FMN reductase n=1 Tax=Streptomyces caniscabiei TaxID=2746961 RepID=UPI0029BDC37F|nr:NADPH-dependent FMN reductase [Streptomyces caniscabiei]MDX2776215.1 NAD(P)H-dependent oxidoreductase [Streptomyces caniscabiei]
MTKIAVFVGSLRKDSFNMKLAKDLEARAPEGVEFAYADIDLPLFNEDVEAADFPAKARALKDLVEGADGVLFVTPEYNRSVPGVLKNAIDWASRPWGTNSFKGKPMGVVGASLNVAGTAAAQMHLRSIASFLEMKQLGQPEVYIPIAEDTFDETGAFSERWAKNLQGYVDALTAWVEAEK